MSAGTRGPRTSRRHFLAAAGTAVAAALLPRRGEGLSAETDVGAAWLSLPGLPNPRPRALGALLAEVGEVTSVPTRTAVPSLSPEDDALFEQPLVALVGDRGFGPLSARGVERLGRYLREGGFLFAEDVSGLEDSPFDASFRREIARVLPGRVLAPIPREHALYRSFFLLRGVPGRIVLRPYLEGVDHGDLTPVVYSRNDLTGAWSGSPGGSWDFEVVPGGRGQRVDARKVGINLVAYALTGNYKLDAVHVRTLLRRMRQEGRIP